MTRLALAAALAACLAAPACAQQPYDYADDRDPYWASRAMSGDGTRVRNTPRYRYYVERHRRWRRHDHGWRHDGPRVYGYLHTHRPAIHRPRCGGEVSAVGTEHYSEEEAKRAAIKSWMAEVRHRLGTEMMDIGQARDMAFRCVVSTPGDRVSDKVAKWTRGELLKECRLVAVPCRPDVDTTLPGDVAR